MRHNVTGRRAAWMRMRYVSAGAVSRDAATLLIYPALRGGAPRATFTMTTGDDTAGA